MAYLQSTIEKIIESERAMVLNGAARYGQHYWHARTAAESLSRCVASVDRDRSDTFGRMFSLMKKQHMLAFLSSLRLHKVQAMLDLRHALEAGAAAAYTIANPRVQDFVDVDPSGTMDPSQNLTNKRYRWLDQNYPEPSEWIREIKGLINAQTAHANIVSGHDTYRVEESGEPASTPFFDIEDEHDVEGDLWLIARAAIIMMGLLYRVAGDVAGKEGRSVLAFRSDFLQTTQGLACENDALEDEWKASDRYKATTEKVARRAKAGPGTGG
jgi:hypothetical protein